MNEGVIVYRVSKRKDTTEVRLVEGRTILVGQRKKSLRVEEQGKKYPLSDYFDSREEAVSEFIVKIGRCWWFRKPMYEPSTVLLLVKNALKLLDD